VAAEVLAELRELPETYAPSWYAEDQHVRVTRRCNCCTGCEAAKASAPGFLR